MLLSSVRHLDVRTIFVFHGTISQSKQMLRLQLQIVAHSSPISLSAVRVMILPKRIIALFACIDNQTVAKKMCLRGNKHISNVADMMCIVSGALRCTTTCRHMLRWAIESETSKTRAVSAANDDEIIEMLQKITESICIIAAYVGSACDKKNNHCSKRAIMSSAICKILLGCNGAENLQSPQKVLPHVPYDDSNPHQPCYQPKLNHDCCSFAIHTHHHHASHVLTTTR